MELETILDLRRKLVMGEDGGSRANLDGANLDGADLCRADLRGANLYGADLRGADLCRADLRGADLRGADLYGADLYQANLDGTNLYQANLDPIKADYFAVLESAKDEVSGIYKALLDGEVDGHIYEIPGIRPEADRAAERWFTGIRAGDTPDNNPVSKITREWTEEFAAKHGIRLPTRRIVWEEAP